MVPNASRASSSPRNTWNTCRRHHDEVKPGGQRPRPRRRSRPGHRVAARTARRAAEHQRGRVCRPHDPRGRLRPVGSPAARSRSYEVNTGPSVGSRGGAGRPPLSGRARLNGAGRRVAGIRSRLISRPIDRYSIGDRTPGLQTGPDGSVTIYMQTQEPTPEKRSNWLPTPAGAFRPVIRMYQPRQEVLDGTYTLPAITRPGSPADACNVEVVKRDARVLRHQCSGAGGPAV